MNLTKIEWVRNPDGSPGYTWNPITGCKNHTPEGLCLDGLFPCYAWKLAHTRLKQRYLSNPRYDPSTGNFDDPFYPRFWENRVREEFGACTSGAVPKGIFVCDMGDLFGQGIPEEWTRRILNHIGMSWYREHRFYLLTKQPQNLIKFSPFPDNVWVGVTATNTDMLLNAINCLEAVEARIKYISLEPLLSWGDTSQWVYPLSDSLKGLSWLLLGACTGTLPEMVSLCEKYPELAIMGCGNKVTAQPRIEWVREIVEAADKAGIKVFLKDNLRGLLPKEPPFYTKCCAEVNGKDPCYEEPCLSEHLVDECSKAPNFWMLRQEMPK